MSRTDDIQEYYSAHGFSAHTVATQQLMPPVEHQRTVRLSDLNRCDSQEGPNSPGCLPFFDRFRHKSRSRTNVEPRNVRPKEQLHEGRRQRSKQPPMTPKEKQEQLAVDLFLALGVDEPERQRPNYIIGLSPKPSPQVAAMFLRHDQPTPIEPTPNYKKFEGQVHEHAVEIAQPAVVHQSVHLTHTPSNHLRADHDHKKSRFASQMTNFGDFMHTPKQASHTEPLPPWPAVPSKEASYDPPNGAEGEQEVTAEPRECSICGTPNSPGTLYGEQGLWLCTACRTPVSTVEFPPRKDSVLGPKRRKQSAGSHKADIADAKNAGEVCAHCHTSLPSEIREGVEYCSWCCRQLRVVESESASKSARRTLLGERSRKDGPPVGKDDAEKEWERFDSDNPYQPDGATSPGLQHCDDHQSKDMKIQEWVNQQKKFKPTPPLKDSVYLSRKQSISTLRRDSDTLPPSQNPPLPPKSKTRQIRIPTIMLPDRASFYPSTPTETPSPPKTPKRPTAEKKSRARKTSSVYPPTPKSGLLASEFPFPPPPIPEGKLHGSKGNGGKYRRDAAPRIHTPDWQQRSPLRNTSFYAYWETILG